MNVPSNREWEIAEKQAEIYESKIYNYFTESVPSINERLAKVKVLIPLTENINQEFAFMAPLWYREAGHTELKEYFEKHICKFEDIIMCNDLYNESVINRLDEAYEDGVYYIDGERFEEMATIAGGFMSIRLAVYGKEGYIPHFHFYKEVAPNRGISKEKKHGGGCICIESANYFNHGTHKETLDRYEIEELINFLRSDNDDEPTLTNWQSILLSWNQGDGNKKHVSSKLKIPNYTSGMESIHK